MSDLHRGSRFLRLLRSICTKTACARRAIVALFVAVATILATFMIMPSASMGASQQGEPSQVQTQNGNAENKTAADNKVAAQGEAAANSKAEEPKTVDPKNSQPPAKQDATNADHAQNVDSEKKQNPAVEDAKKDIKDAKKEESAKKLRRQKRELGNTRAAAGGDDFPEECKNVGSLAECYKVKYEPHFSDRGKISVRGQEFPANPTFKPVEKKFKSKKVNYEKFVTGFVLEKLMVSKSEEAKNNGLVTLEPKTGKITVYANKWIKGPQNYYAYVKVTYSDGSYTTNFDCPTDDTKCVKSKPLVRLSFSVARIEGAKGDLSLKVYDNRDSTTGNEVKDNGTAATVEPDKDGKFSKITPIFIDTTSAKKPNPIYHRMICHKDGNSSDYHLDSINGLTLTNSAAGGNKVPTQKQWDPASGERPGEESAKAYTVYENDPFTERSQSWITGTPNEAGDFTCRVFAFNDAEFSPIKTSVGKYVDLFNSNISDNSKLQSVFEDPMKAFGEYEDGYKNSLSSKKTIDWDVKTIKIVFNSNNVVGDNDLKLSVYPFKNGDGSLPAALTSDNNKISAMLGMELKPYIEATSAEDSANKITLRVLCKGEKKNNNAAGSGDASTGSTGSSGDTSGTGSQPVQPSESSQTAEATWSSNPDGLGLSGVPEDKDQTRCKKGDKGCTAAAQTTMEVSIKPTDVGDYQCVVYALKQDVLDKFNTEVAKTGVTPDTLSAAFKSAKLTANKDYAQLAINIHVPKKFELPDTGGQNWNLQLGAVAAVMVSVLAAGFVISQSEACRKLLYERRRC